MRASKPIAILLSATMLVACTEQGGPFTKQQIGTGVGAVGGGLLGSTIGGGAGRVVAIIGGALLGGFLGSEVGKSMDNADRAAYDRASQRAMENGTRQSWKNPDSGHHGTITPARQFTNGEGQPCREYTQNIYIEGKRHTGHGTACRQADGTWQIANE